MKSIVKQERWCVWYPSVFPLIGDPINGGRTLHTLHKLLPILRKQTTFNYTIILVDEFRYVRNIYSMKEAERILKLDLL